MLGATLVNMLRTSSRRIWHQETLFNLDPELKAMQREHMKILFAARRVNGRHPMRDP